MSGSISSADSFCCRAFSNSKSVDLGMIARAAGTAVLVAERALCKRCALVMGSNMCVRLPASECPHVEHDYQGELVLEKPGPLHIKVHCLLHTCVCDAGIIYSFVFLTIPL